MSAYQAPDSFSCTLVKVVLLDTVNGFYGDNLVHVSCRMGWSVITTPVSHSLIKSHTPSLLQSTANRYQPFQTNLRHSRLLHSTFKMSRPLPVTHSGMKKHNHGFTLPNGTRISHQTGAVTKTPFTDLGFPVDMHELSANPSTTLDPETQRPITFAGQFGLIDFDTSVRLPRHVHIAPPDVTDPSKQRFVAERILVLSGTALTELNGEIYIIPPRTLVTIAPGVPHTWTACPAGVSPATAFPEYDADMLTEQDKIVSEGRFLMVYEYEEETGFFPTKQTHTMQSVSEYVKATDNELEGLRFPALSSEEVLRRGWTVWGGECRKVGGGETPAEETSRRKKRTAVEPTQEKNRRKRKV